MGGGWKDWRENDRRDIVKADLQDFATDWDFDKKGTSGREGLALDKLGLKWQAFWSVPQEEYFRWEVASGIWK